MKSIDVSDAGQLYKDAFHIVFEAADLEELRPVAVSIQVFGECGGRAYSMVINTPSGETLGNLFNKEMAAAYDRLVEMFEKSGVLVRKSEVKT